MAHVKVTVYKNSCLATLIGFVGTCISMFGGLYVCAGIFGLMDGEPIGEAIGPLLLGVVIAAVGIGTSIYASIVSSIVAHNKWVKNIRVNGLEPEIQRSVEVACAVYMSNQTERAKKYISKLNPQAVEYFSTYLAQQAEKTRREEQVVEQLGESEWRCSFCSAINDTDYCIKCGVDRNASKTREEFLKNRK